MDEVIKRKRGRPSAKKQLNKEALFQLALKAFAEQGYNGVRMSALAKGAGVANSLLNYYFQTEDGVQPKENLWKQTMLYAYEQLQEKFKSVHRNFKDLEGIPLLKVLTRQYVYFAAEFPEYSEIFTYEMSVKSDRADWLLKNLAMPMHEQVDKVYRREQKNGNIKNFDTANLILITMGAANLFFNYKYFLHNKYGVEVFQEAEIEKHADAVIEIIFNGMIDNQNK